MKFRVLIFAVVIYKAFPLPFAIPANSIIPSKIPTTFIRTYVENAPFMAKRAEHDVPAQLVDPLEFDPARIIAYGMKKRSNFNILANMKKRAGYHPLSGVIYQV